MRKNSAAICPSRRARALEVLLLSLVGVGPAAATFTTFESGQVRPLALSPDGNRLFALDTPDNRLEIFSVSGAGLTHVASVPVGLEPVAVAARTNGEVWVVNHLSDSVSIVDVQRRRRRSRGRSWSATSPETSSSRDRRAAAPSRAPS
jgi:DNA-binding beta-propeller fold protein YncE